MFFDDNINSSSIVASKTLELNGGRIEKRICRASNDTRLPDGQVDWLTNLKEWSGLKSIFSVTRIITAKGRTSEETAYYITSLENNPEELLYISRSHWKIESMHWFLDVVWNEDYNNLRSINSQKVMNSFRKLALFAHKQYISTLKKKPSVKQNVLHSLLDDNLCFSVFNALACFKFL